MNGLTFKPGVLPIMTIAKAGTRLLSALDVTARRVKVDLVITCADKEHDATDPHSLGEAYDIRTHGLTDSIKRTVLRELMLELADPSNGLDMPVDINSGIGTLHFWGWIEHPGADNEHLHVQRRHGTVYV